MRYLSLFSGIEAATVAWHPLGWQCVAVSEIEPFPCKVLAHHYPNVPNLGDVTKITEQQLAALGPIDIVVFGSPCQDLSVAGKRKGLLDANGDATRSGLFFTAVNIIHWARKHCGCRFALWENVPGAFSSNKGRDFASVVEWLAGLDDIEVPPKGWGNEGVAVGDEAMVEWATLDAQFFGVAQRRRRVFALADFGNWTNRPPILLEPEGLRGDSPPSRKEGESVAGTTGASSKDCRVDTFTLTGFAKYEETEIAGTLRQNLNKEAHDLALTYDMKQHHNPQPSDTMQMTTLNNAFVRGDTPLIASPAKQVRRLTPVECERLQGFPDNYTDIKPNGKPTPDGPRYKALGNSMAVPVMHWIGEQIDIATAEFWG